MRMHVAGVSAEVNRYYVISSWLRELGWQGAGDRWWDGHDWHTFDGAAFIMNLYRRYEAEALRERWIDMREAAVRAFTNLAESLRPVVEKLRQFSELVDDGERYTAYEEAWFEWAEEVA